MKKLLFFTLVCPILIFSLLPITVFAVAVCGSGAGVISSYKCMDPAQGDPCVDTPTCPTKSQKCCKPKPTTEGTTSPGTTGTGGTTTPTTTTGGTGGGGGTTGILPACAETGRCTVCDLLQVAVNFGQFLFGIVGALVLLYFFYGGFLWLTSAGASEKIKRGKDVLINSVIGLIIVFGAYGGIVFIVNAVTGGGFNWQTNLKCAELPAPVKWTLPGAEQGQVHIPTGTGGTGTGGTTGGTTTGGTGPGTTPGTTPSPTPSDKCDISLLSLPYSYTKFGCIYVAGDSDPCPENGMTKEPTGKKCTGNDVCCVKK
jgi:hypothetical protein